MSRRSQRLGLILTLAMLSVFALVSVVQAEGEASARPKKHLLPPVYIHTILTVRPLEPIELGEPFTVTARLMTTDGKPIEAERLALIIGGEHIRQALTDSRGMAYIGVQSKPSAGTYTATVEYTGSRTFAPSNGATKLVVNPSTLQVQIVPPLPNINFLLDGHPFKSDANGIARIQVNQVNTYTLAYVQTADDPNANYQAKFDRWIDEVFVPTRTVDLPLAKPLQIGLAVNRRVSQTFVDLANQPVEPGRVMSLTLRGSSGGVYTFNDVQPRWLPSSRIMRRGMGLEETKILYSVMSVIVDGSNVVSQARQRFFAEPDDQWQIQLLFYSAHFTARDALFNFPIGTGIQLDYPDGRSEVVPFQPGAQVKIESLVRGIYQVKVIGFAGPSITTPVALSRDQQVDLQVISYLDIGVILTLGVVIVFGLLFIGRPHWLLGLRTRTASAFTRWRTTRRGTPS